MPWNNNTQSPWGSPSGGGGGGGNDQGGGGNPWGGPPEPPQRRPQRPGGNRGQGGGGGPDLSDWLRRNKLPGNLPGNNLQLGIGIGVVLLLILIVSDSLYRVQPQEQGLVLTFGAWDGVPRDPGLHVKLPRPFQTVEKVAVTFQRKTEVGFRSNGNQLPDERFMITADENIVDVRFVVQWVISNAGNFQFNIRDPERMVAKAAESVMREVVGRTPVDLAITTARTAIADETKMELQELLNSYESGIEIQEINIQQIELPRGQSEDTDVIAAFNDVQRASQDKERAQNEAERYRQSRVPEARGIAQQRVNAAEAARAAVVNRARGEAARFSSVLSAYREAEDVTRARLYLETMEQVLANARKVIMEGGRAAAGGLAGGGVLPLLPLNDLPAPQTPSAVPATSGSLGAGGAASRAVDPALDATARGTNTSLANP